jgi:putative holliday junction resolvase
MKFLGIDYGTKRVGVAISDDAGEFAFPKGILNTAEVVSEIETMCSEEAVQGIVIGESIASNEQENDTQTSVKKFAALLAAKTSIAIYFEREDFSSVEAHRYQTDAGKRDDSAAAIILQRFLDKRQK